MSEPPVVSALIDTFTSMVAHKVFEEVSLITNFKNDFEFLCDELFSVKLLLDEAGQNSTSPSMSNWLEKLEYFLIDAVDIVDECRESNIGKSIFSNFQKLLFRYKMGNKIRILRERINNIHGSAKYLKHLKFVLQVNALNSHMLEDRRQQSSALVNESHLVGVKEGIDKITEILLKEEGPQIIAVVGMGGIGKTLLVERVVRTQIVQKRFQNVVWLSVPQNFEMKHLLPEINKKMKHFPLDNQNETTDHTVQNPNLTIDHTVPNPDPTLGYIKDKIERSSCLFVLDDIWNKNDFKKLGSLLNNATKIIVTTRDKRAVYSISPDQQLELYPMKHLSPKNSKKLFCIHAFPDRGKRQQSSADRDINLANLPQKEGTSADADINLPIPKQLQKFADQIVKKCGGLPLALKTVGASMARVRRLPNDWESILKCLNEAEAMSDQVWPSLNLSYQALPYHLKLCFDYCSSFPKNSQIKSKYLVNAWIGEGFTPRTAENPYDIGLSYIDELVDRCLLEVLKVGGDGRVKSCKIHDLLHELANSESHKKTKCLLKPGQNLEKFPEGQLGLRRISLIANNISKITEPIKCPRLRTLFLCNNVRLESISPSFFNDMKYLAVLDLSGTFIKSLPETVKHLNHLKLLNLSQTEIEKLPKSLAELRSLQFLDVSHCESLQEIHLGIGENRSMLHLNVKGSHNLETLPLGISKLIYLHTLKGLVFKRAKAPTAKALQLSSVLKRAKAANANALQWWDLKGLTLLQHLSLTLEAPSSEGIIQLEEGTFAGMTNMRALYFTYIDSSEGSGGILELPKDMAFMHRLEILHLNSCVVQDWIFRLQNLMELELYGDNSSASNYKGLGSIPNLSKLKLSSNNECVEFPKEFGEPGAFPKLENLVIERFHSLEHFPSLEDGAFPMLKCLQMKFCFRLKDITKSLQGPSSVIEEIRVIECPGWEDGIINDNGTWQLLKARPIKLTINTYTISWASDQSVSRGMILRQPRSTAHAVRMVYLFKKEYCTSAAGAVG